jgi:hypothetical protein
MLKIGDKVKIKIPEVFPEDYESPDIEVEEYINNHPNNVYTIHSLLRDDLPYPYRLVDENGRIVSHKDIDETFAECELVLVEEEREWDK